MPGSRTDQAVISVTRDRDKKPFGLWKDLTGWGVDSNVAYARDGYGLPREPLGGPKMRLPFSVSRNLYPDRDDDLITQLEADVGSELYTVVRQVVNAQGTAVGATRSATAMLKSCKQSDLNTGDDSPSSATFTLEFEPRTA
jgi:hypothetical protein